MTSNLDNARPDVSILIVNYNVKDYLLQCLRSIEAREDDLRVQIVVVDNASQDQSVEHLAPLFPHVKWISLDENIGFGRGNNVGLEACTGRHVLFLNPDTIIGQDTLSVMVAYLDDHPEVGLAGCRVLNPDGSFQLACRRGRPTPWAAFCKLFGLQSMFPQIPLFAGYNLTYRSIDETYDVDALIGAFMIGPRDLIHSVGGFDPQFFMYGEDLDLCFRVQQQGRSIRYVHTTSIVHYKGESTKRSSMNEVKVFYDAMEIFARKHFGRSRLFMLFLRVGIIARSVVERVSRKRVEIGILMADLLVINLSLLIATAVRFEGPLGFPSYAYPTVFIIISLVGVLSLVGVGEYVEYRPSIRRSAVGLLVMFFILSSLTYFFKEYAFSRGVVLMTVGFSLVGMTIVRAIVALMDSTVGKRSVRNILLVGANDATSRIIQALTSAEHRQASLVGVVEVDRISSQEYQGVPIVGTTDFLDKIIETTDAHEVIVTDSAISQARVMQLMVASSHHGARFHMASDYDDIVTARIIDNVAGLEPTVPHAPLLRFRNRVTKRAMDVVIGLAVVPFLALRLSLGSTSARRHWAAWLGVVSGTYSVVGLYPDGKQRIAGKIGITGLAHISRSQGLSEHAIEQLNDYYVDRFTLALDFEILLKHLLRRRG
jgi:O-antigen biosynthesis protein